MRKTENLHQLDLILRHHPFAIARRAVTGRGLIAITISPQVSSYYGKVPGQAIGYFVPNYMGLRMTM